MGYAAVLALALATGVYSQSTKYIDPNTGISFAGTQVPQITLGFASPETPGSDIIGQIVSNTLPWRIIAHTNILRLHRHLVMQEFHLAAQWLRA